MRRRVHSCTAGGRAAPHGQQLRVRGKYRLIHSASLVWFARRMTSNIKARRMKYAGRNAEKGKALRCAVRGARTASCHAWRPWGARWGVPGHVPGPRELHPQHWAHVCMRARSNVELRKKKRFDAALKKRNLAGEASEDSTPLSVFSNFTAQHSVQKLELDVSLEQMVVRF